MRESLFQEALEGTQLASNYRFAAAISPELLHYCGDKKLMGVLKPALFNSQFFSTLRKKAGNGTGAWAGSFLSYKRPSGTGVFSRGEFLFVKGSWQKTKILLNL